MLPQRPARLVGALSEEAEHVQNLEGALHLLWLIARLRGHPVTAYATQSATSRAALALRCRESRVGSNDDRASVLMCWWPRPRSRTRRAHRLPRRGGRVIP